MKSTFGRFLTCFLFLLITLNLQTSSVDCKRYGRKREKNVQTTEPPSVLETPDPSPAPSNVTEDKAMDSSSSHEVKVTVDKGGAKSKSKKEIGSEAKQEEVDKSSASKVVEEITSLAGPDYPSSYSYYPAEIPGAVTEESKIVNADYPSSAVLTEQVIYPEKAGESVGAGTGIVGVGAVGPGPVDLQVENSLHYGGPIGYGGYGHHPIPYPVPIKVVAYPVRNKYSFRNFGKRFGFFNGWSRALGFGMGYARHSHRFSVPGYKQYNGGFHKTFEFFG